MKYFIESEKTVVEGMSKLDVASALIPFFGTKGMSSNLQLYFKTKSRNIPIPKNEIDRLGIEAENFLSLHQSNANILPIMSKKDAIAYLVKAFMNEMLDFAAKNNEFQTCKLILLHKDKLLTSASEFIAQKREYEPLHALNQQLFYNFVYELATAKQRGKINVNELPFLIAHTLAANGFTYCVINNKLGNFKIAIYEEI